MTTVDRSNIEKQLFWTRFAMFGISSVFLYTSGLLVFSAFAPLTLAYLFLGQNIWLTLSGLCTLIVSGTSILTGTFDLSVFGGFLLVVIASFVVAQLFKKGMSPQKITGLFAALCAVVLGAGVVYGMISMNLSYTGFLDDLSAKLIASMQLDKLDGNAKVAFEGMPDMLFYGVKLKYLIPSIVWVASILQIWIGIFFVIRYSALWRVLTGYKYSLRDFVEFRNNDYIVIPFIILLGLFLFGYYQKVDLALVVSVNLLFAMSFFFFLHGFGVFMDFLKFVKIRGLFKSIFVVVGLLFINRLLVVVGIFDLWINFRKFFEKKKES